METANFSLHYSDSRDVPARPDAVFEFLDDFARLGGHMMNANWMMAGSRMTYEFDAQRGRSLGSVIRLRGSMLGLDLRIDEIVSAHAPPHRKAWSTIGSPRLIVMSGYRMGFQIDPAGPGSHVRIFIDYALPTSGAGRWLGRLLAHAYARWCVRSMSAAVSAQFGPRLRSRNDLSRTQEQST